MFENVTVAPTGTRARVVAGWPPVVAKRMRSGDGAAEKTCRSPGSGLLPVLMRWLTNERYLPWTFQTAPRTGLSGNIY